MKNKKKEFADLLRQIPVSINNFYGDPTLQWADTLAKLDDLLETGHIGPVGLITKGKLTNRHCWELAERQARGLNLVVLVSISELQNMEKVAMHHRYTNIKKLGNAGVPAIGYIRPLTPPYNTSPETIEKIFRSLSGVGCDAVVVSGFRGDDHLISEMQPDEVVEWTLRVKIMTPKVWEDIFVASQKYGVQLFTRTSCAVDYLLGNNRTYNPYYNSPNLVKCNEVVCPMRATCVGPQEPRKNSIEFLKFLGYDVEFISGGAQQLCMVEPHNRLKCESCCTTCFILDKNSHILVRGSINLGDLTFIRFISGMIAMQPGCKDDGALDIGAVHFKNFPKVEGIQCLNSWWPIARVGKKCFDCKYCIEKYYGSTRIEYGFSPARLLEKI